MLNVFVNTILPIFAIIALGFFLKTRGLIRPDTARSLNQMVFYVAIPAMLLTKLTKFSFNTSFDFTALIALLGALVSQWLIAWICAKSLRLVAGRRATFIQSCMHGNLGYMAYAVAYYALDEAAFARVAVLGGFLMISQNLLAVVTMASQNDTEPGRRWRTLLKSIVYNPIIISVVVAISISLKGWSLPVPLHRFLDILSGMSFPLALLIIGVTLSFGPVRAMIKEIVGIGLLKLLVMPFVGYVLMILLNVSAGARLPGLILLAGPPATVTYVFATEMKGDPELAASSVSIHTLLCAVSYSLLFYLFKTA